MQIDVAAAHAHTHTLSLPADAAEIDAPAKHLPHMRPGKVPQAIILSESRVKRELPDTLHSFTACTRMVLLVVLVQLHVYGTTSSNYYY